MYVKRETYLEKLIGHKNNKLIKIITGARRVGKSFLLFNIFYDYLISIGVNKNQIFTFKLDEIKYSQYKDPVKLIDYIESNKLPDLDNYVFIDEVQNCERFEEMLNYLNFSLDCKVYVTGSNSKMLSYELNTLLRGRTIEIKVFPLSFKEIYESGTFDKEKLYDDYMLFGGLPELLYYNDNKYKIDYLVSYNKDIIGKDIIERYNLRTNNHFQKVYEVIMSSIGSLINARKITNTFISLGYKTVTADTILNYLRYMIEACLINEAKRYDIKRRKYISFQSKYYSFDVGIRNTSLDFRQIDKGHILENIVFNELSKRYRRVDIGINSKKEVDFIVNNDDNKYYIQVCLDLNASNSTREIDAFKGIDDGFKKIVITNQNSIYTRNQDGYIFLDIFTFLLDEQALEKA
ncbi:MAG: ATP-binding protein [Acholeplasmatales bacterium]|jgi:predicted AAA+ superfamily ATPase|nr:ATP-binding protein [Acholeplasmatales bacterium]